MEHGSVQEKKNNTVSMGVQLVMTLTCDTDTKFCKCIEKTLMQVYSMIKKSGKLKSNRHHILKWKMYEQIRVKEDDECYGQPSSVI